ncbi:hypothetical protein LTR78_006472 [Recurvomyces mirabilis]|uniref:Uncharacterized protein n=1 Tax=Recurvomyces mirabilis TaxID=574656 RepID=A0AAE1BZX5_9PEZI|nr:hypothetical protein LTR78_006472 [Recurvomyces mirabilis]KAK5151109.1 hypothetical protein LTS14_009605 [Recurvomyces mirabilis]
MPNPQPLSYQSGSYDNPPSSETSTPRTRREGLHRAIRNTSFLAREAGNNSMSDQDRRPRSTLLSPINRRRYRSPSNAWESPRDTPETSDSAQGRRSKRRKLDGEDGAVTSTPAIKYGHFGQVEPGTLKLDLISCDGGEHVDPRSPGLYLGVKNVLQHNKSVYCSERPTANIILKHADDTVFDLEKLHIVAPEHGFTAPVREGLVYVAMTLKDLEPYLEPPPHARRAAPQRYPSPRRQRRYMNTLRQSPERLTLSDALRDPHIDAALGRRGTDYARAADSAHDLAQAEETYYGTDFGFGREEAEAHCEIPSLDNTTATEPNSNIILGHDDDDDSPSPITILSDEDAGPEEISSQEVLDFRQSRLRLMRRRHELELLDREEERWTAGFPPPPPPPHRNDALREESAAAGGRRTNMPALRARAQELWERHTTGRRGGDPHPESPAHDLVSSNANGYTTTSLPATHMSTTESRTHHPSRPRTEIKDPNVTHAHFSIKPGKHKVTLHFDPGVSGQFILVRVWADGGPAGFVGGFGGCGGGRSRNVDVQSIIAKGFGGCKFFPARGVR